MKVVTSVGVFNDAIGKRMSVTYTEIDDTTGQVISDNKRIDRVVTDQTAIAKINEVTAYAQSYVDSL
jgi:hypothetical protein